MAPVPESNTSAEHQVVLKEYRHSFIAQVNASAHDVTPSGLQGEIDDYLTTLCFPKKLID